MKLIALAGAAALALTAAPAQAGSILPNLYADTFCKLRAAGVSKDDARAAAVKDAWVDANDWSWVTVNGKQYQSDTILAV